MVVGYPHDAVGDGDIDFARLPQAISAVGYESPVVLEVISKNADRDIERSVNALRQAGL
jgi:sugar phosphate isomerase/epimerase